MLKPDRKRRSNNSINAGSMADIAFLLLIFFLVTTSILEDKGIMVRLPPWTEEAEPPDLNPKNLLIVSINSNNELFVRDGRTDISQLQAKAREFILNPRKDPKLSSAPNKALISFKHDRSTSYETYIAVYNELKATYYQIWNEMAEEQYGHVYEDLPAWAKREIQKIVPMVISESEPTDLAMLY